MIIFLSLGTSICCWSSRLFWSSTTASPPCAAPSAAPKPAPAAFGGSAAVGHRAVTWSPGAPGDTGETLGYPQPAPSYFGPTVTTGGAPVQNRVQLVNITPSSLWFMVDISILTRVYKPTYNWGHHIVRPLIVTRSILDGEKLIL